EGPFDIADGGPTINGGTVWVFGAGSTGGSISAPASQSSQGWLAAALNGPFESDTDLLVSGRSGQVLAERRLTETVSVLLFSSPAITNGDVYSVSGADAPVEVTAGEGADVTDMPNGRDGIGGQPPGGQPPGGRERGGRSRPG
ncbi:MAG: hypothetical protein LBU05_04145, partial [Bifidobacteriaceae bacterium]|nr:hypothetical protein [Bifidobacteriaceae bacterium]